MSYINKQQFTELVIEDLNKYKSGFFLTLNALTTDDIKFEYQVERIMHWLNSYCYGRTYKLKSNRFRIIGVIEKGKVNEGLHIHLVIMHNDNIRRSFYELNEFIRRKWYRLIEAKGNRFGTIVNFQHVNKTSERIAYSFKGFHLHHQSFNPLYF